ncbi:MAG: hypothetical protein AAB686_02645 [Patescibacteria group bacterium]
MEIRAGTPSSVAVGTTAVLVVGRNPTRVMLALVNTGAVNLTIGLGSAPVDGAGVVLSASGGSFLIDGNNPFFDGVYAISSGAGTTLAYQETGRG